MSSSVFIERNSARKPISASQNVDTIKNEVPSISTTSSDTNLVVVYGKRGISFDPKGLENLIEEKSLSTISVIRLTSPTPSMQDEEEKDARLELLERQEYNSNENSELGTGSENETDHKTDVSNSDNDSNPDKDVTIDESDESNDDRNPIAKYKSRGRHRIKNLKSKKCLTKKKRERPELVGLKVEDFITADQAREFVKTALRKAGLSSNKRSTDFDFQLYVIKNDHCYTPYTSPKKVKSIIVESVTNTQNASTVRKLISPQPLNKPKTLIQKHLQLEKTPKLIIQREQECKNRKDVKIINSNRVINKVNRPYENTEDIRNDPDMYNSTVSEEDEDESDYVTSDDTDDNDNVNDLDFKLNNRNIRKRKVRLLRKNKRLIKANRNPNTRPSPNFTDSNIKYGIQDRTKLMNPNVNRIPKPLMTFQTSKAPLTSHPIAIRKPFNISSVPHRKPQFSVEQKTVNKSFIQSVSPTTKLIQTHVPTTKVMPSEAVTISPMRKGPIVQVVTSNSQRPQLTKPYTPTSQTIKEIVINKKVMASPKGGFTDINTLIIERERPTKPIPVSSPNSGQPQNPSSSTVLKLKNNVHPIVSIRPMAQSTQSRTIPVKPHNQSNVIITSTKPPIQITTTTSLTNSRPQMQIIATKTVKSQPQSISTNSTKGFTPLGIETAAKNQLPAQISVQTHQSSSELAAEHDKQLDLIDSIVKDELQNIGGAIENESTANEKIPKLVEMLKNTEKALNKSSQMQNSFVVTNDDDDVIDIANNSLLETPVDDIPDDLLQDVVKLIEDDKTLAAAVEKDVFGENDIIDNDLSTASPTLSTIFQDTSVNQMENTSQDEINENIQRRTIIEMTISNSDLLDMTNNTESLTTDNLMSSDNLNSKSALLSGRDSIQVVRGNGRVITLPPIEAPATRSARKRAQTKPSNLSFSISNESSQTYSPQSSSSLTNMDLPDFDLNLQKDSPTPTSRSRRVSMCSVSSSKRSSLRTNKLVNTRINKISTETEKGKSKGDDDDPHKLWCLCRQPHNNRFMICCDRCEDWFHGTCVSITKAMGLEMEEKGVDWTCPKCVKIHEEKTQPKITDMLVSKKPGTATANSTEINTANATPPSQQRANPSQQSRLSPNDHLSDLKKKFEQAKHQIISMKELEQPKKKISIDGNATNKLQLPSTMKTKQTTLKDGYHFKPLKSSEEEQKVIKVNKVVRVENHDISKHSATPCVVCKKPSRVNTVYCSDECIRKHAQAAIYAVSAKIPEIDAIAGQNLDDKKKKSKGLFEDILSMADRKPKVERIHVFERRSGRVIAGINAPTTSTIKKWLLENPSFEVVQAGSYQALEIQKRQQMKASHSRPVSTSVDNISINLATVTHPKHPITSGSTKSQIIILRNTESTQPSTSKVSQKKLSQGSIRLEKSRTEGLKDDVKAREKINKKQIENSSSRDRASDNASPHKGSDQIRYNVRYTLKEQLIQRLSEWDDIDIEEDPEHPSLTNDEITDFFENVEEEMFNYFNQDTGQKYKAKYRSLMFNIKDRKNQTLFTKIWKRLVQPQELVRMSPEELASQELAAWRQNETKHQLEIIKKSELDLLSCTKNYVLKTHKGEEVIESKSTDKVDLDLTIPVEDVVSVLNNSNNDELKASDSISRFDHSMQESKSDQKQKLKLFEKDDRKGKHRDKKHRPKDHHKDKSYSKKSRSRSRSQSKERRHRSLQKDEKRDRDDRDRNRDKDHDKSRDRERGRDRDRDSSRHRDQDRHERNRDQDRESAKNRDRNQRIEREKERIKSHADKKTPVVNKKKKPDDSSSTQIKSDNTAKPIPVCNLIDQIIESTKTIEEAANIKKEKKAPGKPIQSHPPPNTTTSTSGTSKEKHRDTSSTQKKTSQQLEVTSYMTDDDESEDIYMEESVDPYSRYSESPFFWKGLISMIDVASFRITMKPLHGNYSHLGRFLTRELDVVGRIGGDIVWEYISKIKKSPNKEVVLISLLPSNLSETLAYSVLYDYLNKRQRLGVIKTSSFYIKDFYIYPLGKGEELPTVLKSNETLDLLEDENRPNLLIGIIVRIIVRSSGNTPSVPTLNKGIRKANIDNYTPPGSPKRRKRLLSTMPSEDDIDVDAIIKAPIAGKMGTTGKVFIPPVKDDADEPYSPGDSSDDDVKILGVSQSLTLPSVSNDHLTLSMDEINRRIAVHEKEIAGLLHSESSQYKSKPDGASAILNNISIPSNLSQILASINNRPTEHQSQSLTGAGISNNRGTMEMRDTTEEYSPEDAITTSYEIGTKTSSSSSRLAQLSEAELLSMVPDDMIEETKVPPKLAAIDK